MIIMVVFTIIYIYIIFYFSIINLSFDFLLPYKLDEEEKNAKKQEVNQNQKITLN